MELMEWIKIQTLYDSEKQALKIASIVATRHKVFIGNKTGCGGGCESCCSDPLPRKNIAKVLPFRKPYV